MGHPGEKKVTQDVKSSFYHPKTRYHIDKLMCKDCQKHNFCRLWVWSPIQTRGADCTLGRSHHWFDWAMESQSQWSTSWINALTCIATALNLVKLICVDNKTAEHIRNKFTQSWLCRYLHPVWCLHYKGGEFIGQHFQWLLEIFSIKDVCSSSKNQQFSVICERMHQTVNNVIRTLVHTYPSQNMTQARDIIDDALATAMHAMQTIVLVGKFVRNSAKFGN